MFHSKSDIFGPRWTAVIFQGRNQQYGAYVLRRDAAADLTKALFSGIGLFLLLIAIPIIARHLKPAPDLIAPPRLEERIVELMPPKPIDETTPPPPAVAPPPPRKDQVRMPPPVVVPHQEMTTEEPPTADMLKKADPGPATITGNPDADIRIDVPHGQGTLDSRVTESGTEAVPFITVEIRPEFPGGIAKFGEYIGRHFNYPSAAVEQGIRGKVLVQFVVERDGSLTDIQVLRDLGYGTREEAIRVLRASPKWKPGVQNGRTVRVSYTLPLSLDVSAR